MGRLSENLKYVYIRTNCYVFHVFPCIMAQHFIPILILILILFLQLRMADLFFLSQKINSKLEREERRNPSTTVSEEWQHKRDKSPKDIDIDRSPSRSGELREKNQEKGYVVECDITTHSVREEEAKRENLGYF